METAYSPPIAQKHNPGHSSLKARYDDIQKYYDIAGPDYETWSSNFNMHFGYCRKFSDIFSLEKMLMNMNNEVLGQLHITPGKEATIADLGCGMATVARQAAKKYPNAKLVAITIVDYQVEKGKQLTNGEKLDEQVAVVRGNFEELEFADETFTHAYALESACHASGTSKELFIAELARVLKKGGRFCIADGFLKNNDKKPRLFKWLYKRIANYWAVPGFACIRDFENKIKNHGLQNIKVREISYRIAPSVAYVPLVCLKFFFKELWKNRSLRMKKERWHNVYAPFLGMLMGLYRKHFGYYIISGEKR
ncbi:MAG: SAM-dependent methyltransferase [Bacteroidota bacterium]